MSTDSSIATFFACCPIEVLDEMLWVPRENGVLLVDSRKVLRTLIDVEDRCSLMMALVAATHFPNVMWAIFPVHEFSKLEGTNKVMVEESINAMDLDTKLCEKMVPPDPGRLIPKGFAFRPELFPDFALYQISLRLHSHINFLSERVGMKAPEMISTWTLRMLKDYQRNTAQMMVTPSVRLDLLHQQLFGERPPDFRSRQTNDFPMPEEMKESRFVFHCSGDSASVEGDSVAAWEMGVIRDMVRCGAHMGGEKIEVPVELNFNSDDLETVLDFCSTVSRRQPPNLPNLTKEKTFLLNEIADYLRIPSLLEYTSLRIVDMVRGMKDDQIRRILDLDGCMVRAKAGAG
ncbi:hypothetical protein CASFOL_025022 [Castilleja foliolosa]|uniref:Uncharacterized protein n=1 Tax=Castilleja foliolosa TaxID=1961234 RepID=A0ABD3CQ00_9LAMI